MSYEPPGSSDAQEERLATGSSGSEVNRRSSVKGRAKWESVVAAVGVLVVAGGIGVFLFLTQKSDSKPDHVAPARGLACPYLQQAADAYTSGDHVAYNQAISQAAQVAEETLKTSGQTFGEPERIALQLALEQGPRTDVAHLLAAGRDACSAAEQ